MNRKIFFIVLAVFALFGYESCQAPEGQADSEPSRWTAEQAEQWYQAQGWLVGANFTPSTAVNQLEMWQAKTFDTATIDRELGWAEAMGMNVMRVFLHDLLYEQDSSGFIQRINTYLAIADRHHIKTMFVLFDSCWDPFPSLGKQKAPRPHVHNSRWVQGPGQKALHDSTQYPRLERYVKGIIQSFGQDQRVVVWDIWNEPDNKSNSYKDVGLPDKVDYVYPLLKKAFAWARSVHPDQPLTSPLWGSGDWSSDSSLKPIEQLQLAESDIITFHNYGKPEDFEKRATELARYHRPLLCTEYLARQNGSTFENLLPFAKKQDIAMINWGLVAGKTQTNYPWDSWKKTYTAEPDLWQHDILRKDGQPYKTEEVDFIHEMTVAGSR